MGAINAAPDYARVAPAAPPAVAAPQPAAIPPPQPDPQAAPNDIVAVPPLVRAEAMRYTASLRALHEARKPTSKWWQFWRG